MRIAVVDKERCRSDKCDLVCIRFCPMVRTRREAIRLEGDKAYIAEFICSGCGICVRKCPFDALSIVNLPDELEQDHIHRYGPNEFTIYRLPVPREGKVVGLLGKNAIGKSTVLNILAGNLIPNLGHFESPPTETPVTEIDDKGNIDLSNWCLRRSEAEFKEKWFKYIRKLNSEYKRLEKRKAEFWEITSEELGLTGTSLDPAPRPTVPADSAEQEATSEAE